MNVDIPGIADMIADTIFPPIFYLMDINFRRIFCLVLLPDIASHRSG
jgi:hypothetical protein